MGLRVVGTDVKARISTTSQSSVQHSYLDNAGASQTWSLPIKNSGGSSKNAAVGQWAPGWYFVVDDGDINFGDTTPTGAPQAVTGYTTTSATTLPNGWTGYDDYLTWMDATGAGNRTMNGIQKNSLADGSQGFDSWYDYTTSSSGSAQEYNAALNVNPGKTGVDLSVTAGDILMCCISVEVDPAEEAELRSSNYGIEITANQGYFAREYVYVAIVPEAPEVGTIPPPWTGWNGVNYHKEPDWTTKLTDGYTDAIIPASQASLKRVNGVMNTWVWGSQNLRNAQPIDFEPSYYESRGNQFGPMLLYIFGNDTEADRLEVARTLLYNGYQTLYALNAAAYDGADYGRDTTAGALAVFAAWALDDALLDLIATQHIDDTLPQGVETIGALNNNWQYVNAAMIETAIYEDTSNGSNHYEYVDGQEGMPEFFFDTAPITSAGDATRGGNNWNYTYRGIFENASVNYVRAFHLMETVWSEFGLTPLRDYYDRLYRMTVDNGPWTVNSRMAWTTNEKAFYSTTVYGTIGYSPWTGVPEMHTIPTASSAAAGQIQIAFTEWQGLNGGTFTRWDARYQLTSEDPRTGSWTTVQDVTNGATIATGLAAGTYRVGVRSVSSLGAGPWSPVHVPDDRSTISTVPNVTVA